MGKSKAPVDPFDLIEPGSDLIGDFHESLELFGEMELFFQLQKVSFAPFDAVPDALTGDLLVFGDLG